MAKYRLQTFIETLPPPPRPLPTHEFIDERPGWRYHLWTMLIGLGVMSVLGLFAWGLFQMACIN